MQTEHQIFIKHNRENLERQGYIQSAAEQDFFDAMFSDMKAAHPEARCVKKVGEGSIHQIIYLPKAVRSLKARLNLELAQYERDAANTRKALEKLRQQ